MVIIDKLVIGWLHNQIFNTVEMNDCVEHWRSVHAPDSKIHVAQVGPMVAPWTLLSG